MGESEGWTTFASVFRTCTSFSRSREFKLNRNNWDYIVGGTETETTLARNRQSLDCIAFKPRVLRNVQNVDCSTELYGRKIRIPVLIAPVGGLQLFWEGGVATVAEAAGEFGIPMMQSSATEPPLEERREAGPRRVQDLPALCARRRQVRRRVLQALAGCGLRAAVLLHGRSRALFAARARHGEAPRPHRQPQRGGASQSCGARLGHASTASRSASRRRRSSSRASRPPRTRSSASSTASPAST